MKRIVFIITMVLVASSTILPSCSGGGTQKKGKATAKVLSAPYELLLVAHKSWLSAGDGIEFRRIVDCPIVGIPQLEPNFRVTALEPHDYKGKYLMYGNIFIADIDARYNEPELDVQYDVNACPQIVITVKAPTSERMMAFLDGKQDSVLNLFVQHELKRERNILIKSHSAAVLRAADKMFGAKFFAPIDVDAVFKKDNFFRAVSSKRFQVMNICMYSYPYTSLDDFNKETFIQKRDSAMRKWVYGDTEENYMCTDPRSVVDKKTTMNGKFVYQVRGLWVYNKAPFGGPFVSYSFVDEPNNRVVVAEGFIWAPEEKKRPLIRELEAAVQTVELK
ncbi:MAG: DUF4837 family protein [Bacteroidaceae bacterium]|nr:DUF4837 family protein [Bacteroidaceae bacterium]